MGPAYLKDYQNLDVPPHPHIGLSTLTYLFEGSIFHRDSIGSAIEIQPGAVNWMTAGKGVTHSERTPEYLRHTDKDYMVCKSGLPFLNILRVVNPVSIIQKQLIYQYGKQMVYITN